MILPLVERFQANTGNVFEKKLFEDKTSTIAKLAAFFLNLNYSMPLSFHVFLLSFLLQIYLSAYLTASRAPEMCLNRVA